MTRVSIPPLVDIGANLTHESFAADFADVIARARSAGVERIILTGTDLPTSHEAALLSTQQPDRFAATAGFHPHVASTFTAEASAAIAELATRSEVVAVGECGLDYNRDFSPREAQISVFEAHLEIAAATHKPLFLHQREAHEDFYKILSARRADLVGGVVHCFTDTRAALEAYLDLDMYIGITGWVCDERRGKDLQEIVRHIPLDRLLVETDAPYLLPRTLKPRPKTRRNEPCYLPEVVTRIAECYGCEFDDIARHSTLNAHRLFTLGMGHAEKRR